MELTLPSAFPAIVPHSTSWNSPCLSGRALPADQAQVAHLYSGPLASFSHTEPFATRLSVLFLFCLLGLVFLLPRPEASTANTAHIWRVVGTGCWSTYTIKSFWCAAQGSHKGQRDSDLYVTGTPVLRTLCSHLGTSATSMMVLRVHLPRVPAQETSAKLPVDARG